MQFMEAHRPGTALRPAERELLGVALRRAANTRRAALAQLERLELREGLTKERVHAYVT